MKNIFRLLVLLVASLLLAACGTTGTGTSTTSTNTYSGYGVVQSIELVKQGSSDSSIGLGTVAGGVVGGVLGSQVGAGSGQTAATIGGAAAGAYVGHQMEKGKTGTADAYKFTIRMDDGSYQSVMQSAIGNFRVGDRVRLENGVLTRQ